MRAFVGAVDVMFRDRHIALAASYLAGGVGPGVPVRVIKRAPDRFASYGEGRFVADSVIVDVRVSEVALLATGDRLVIEGATYEVTSDPVRDSQRLTWSASVRAL